MREATRHLQACFTTLGAFSLKVGTKGLKPGSLCIVMPALNQVLHRLTRYHFIFKNPFYGADKNSIKVNLVNIKKALTRQKVVKSSNSRMQAGELCTC